MFKDVFAYKEAAKEWSQVVTDVVFQAWGSLGAAKISIILALNHLSLRQGRSAVEVSATSLANGFRCKDDGVFSGLGMVIRSVKTHIDELCTLGFINVFQVLGKNGSNPGSKNIIEIDFKKLFVGVEFVEIVPSNDVCKICIRLHEYIDRYYIPSLSLCSLDKSKLLPAGFTTPGEVEKPNTGGVAMLAVPKHTRAVTNRPESIKEVIAATRLKSITTRATRTATATAAPASKLNIANLQALLDTAMSSYLPNHPRMIVTAKPFSILRKRLVSAAVPDFAGFLDWTIRSWESLASQNRASILRDPSKLQKGQPLPASPSFTALAYKLPYFVTAYSNYLSSKREDGKTAGERKIEKLLAQLAEARNQNQILRQRKAAPQPASTFRRSATPAQVNDVLNEDWTPPEWTPRDARKEA